MQAAVGMPGADPADVFAEIRARKDRFRGMGRPAAAGCPARGTLFLAGAACDSRP